MSDLLLAMICYAKVRQRPGRPRARARWRHRAPCVAALHRAAALHRCIAASHCDERTRRVTSGRLPSQPARPGVRLWLHRSRHAEARDGRHRGDDPPCARAVAPVHQPHIAPLGWTHRMVPPSTQRISCRHFGRRSSARSQAARAPRSSRSRTPSAPSVALPIARPAPQNGTAHCLGVVVVIRRLLSLW